MKKPKFIDKLNLKREAMDFDYPELPKRFRKTVEFIESVGYFLCEKELIDNTVTTDFNYGSVSLSMRVLKVAPTLDIGPSNAFGKKIADHFGFPYNHTVGDLDFDDWCTTKDNIYVKDYKNVMCFEILEHLKNPAYFLKKLKREYLQIGSKMFVSLPRHSHPHFWGNTHFHEFDDKRTNNLFLEAGFEIESKDWYIHWPKFSQFFRGKKLNIRGFEFWIPGIRPMLRLFTGYWLLGTTIRYFYILRVK